MDVLSAIFLPEAIEGSPFSIIHDGDEIIIDIKNGKVEASLTNEQIEKRQKKWKAPEPKTTKGYLGFYSKVVSSASKGAIIDYKC